MNENNVWSQLLAAVEYVAAIARPDLTVTGALDEALRWWITELLDPTDSYAVETAQQLPWDVPDPFRATLDRLLTSVPAYGLAGRPSPRRGDRVRSRIVVVGRCRRVQRWSVIRIRTAVDPYAYLRARHGLFKVGWFRFVSWGFV